MLSQTRPVTRLIEEISRATSEYAHARKLLLCQTPAQGRELLRAVALAGFPWMGWKVTTSRALAHELILLDLARDELRRGDDFDLLAIADAAIDAVEARGESGPFHRTTGNSGYREAIRRTLESLRAGGVTPEQLRQSRRGDPKLHALAALLAEFERGLRENHLLDAAAVMGRATVALEQGHARMPQAQIFLLGGQGLRGVSGRFLQTLLNLPHVHLLEADSVVGLPSPQAVLWQAAEAPTGPLSSLHTPLQTEEPPRRLDLFAAATPVDELREVLRRVVDRRIPWDRVEIVTTDTVTYGAALDTLARRLEIPVTYARGLDSRRTRAGRAVEAYLRWIGEDFPADVLRGMLDSGDLTAPPGFEEVSSAALARRLRRLRIGWGRDRYMAVLDRAESAVIGPADVIEDIDPEEVERRQARERSELRALRALLRVLLASTPAPVRAQGIRESGGGAAVSAAGASPRTSPAALAAGVLAFLDLVPSSGAMAESTMRKMLRERLSRIRDTLVRETSWDAAIGILRAHLVTRIAPPGERGIAPWTSTSGHLYLSDFTTGGLSLRPHVFVVGMDAGRVTGVAGTDPLLTDADRVALAARAPGSIAPVATSAELIVEGRHATAVTLARLRGEITLSYSAWESAEGRSISPAPELLQALRLRDRDDTLTYEALREAMGPLVGAVPGGSAHLDGDDVWLSAIADGRRMRAGTDVVRSVYPGLDAGLRARDARRSEEATAYDGVIEPRPELDPLGSDTVFSATRLETLGTCPRRYFYQYVLGVMPLRDPVPEPDVWLDAMERGSLLHAVYERTLREARARAIDYAEDAFEALATAVLEAEAEEALRDSPPPSQSAHDRERTDLRDEVRTWIAMIRADRPDWIEVELRFGAGEREARIAAGRGHMRVRGAIDRVDRLSAGGLRIVDYKTGSASRYRQAQPFAGGRRIQHVLYTLAAEQLMDESVREMEYHFPTRKGQMRRVAYGEEAMERGAKVLEHLLEIAADGHFVTTEDAKDCRFCEFAVVCRATEGRFGSVNCEQATWSKEIGMEQQLPSYLRLKALREIDD